MRGPRRTPLMIVCALLSAACLSAPSVAVSQEENLEVLHRWVEWSDPSHMLIHTFNDNAFEHLDRRAREIAPLNTMEAWQARQRKVRAVLDSLVGPFPDKTPLNSEVTGVVRKDGYRIEKVLFESMPDFRVTACLYVPDGLDGPAPAILNLIGHTDIAFRGEGYQRVILNLVRQGFIVFAVDPIGQGERKQYWDPARGRSVVGGATAEHSYVGRQCFISGVSVAKYFIWDGIRAVDYLLTREEVDPKRIGITGISGGGTQTSYIWAMDDRLAAAAPTCYITGFRRLLQSIGPQDAEQNFWRGVSSGITHADFLEVRAPAPAIVVATTRDFFSIQGARESWREALSAYRAYGAEGRLRMAEDDHGHGFTEANREATYRFFRAALNHPGDSRDREVTILEPEELHVTPTGQLIGSVGGKTVFDINREYTLGLLDKIEQSRKSPAVHVKRVIERAKELSGYAPPAGPVEPVFRGRWQREGYAVEMYAVPGEGECVVPLLLFVPEDVDGPLPAAIYLNPDGKQAEAAPGGEIERMMKQGGIVAAVDVSGIGEVEADGSAAFAGVLIGRSVVGVQAADIVRVVRMLSQRDDIRAGKITAFARGSLCPALLHAAAFEPRIAGVTLDGGPVSYASIVTNRFYDWTFDCAVAGALTSYDLADLAAAVAPRPLTLSGLLDERKQALPAGDVRDEYSFAAGVYGSAGAGDSIRIE